MLLAVAGLAHLARGLPPAADAACARVGWHNVEAHFVPLADGTTFVTTGNGLGGGDEGAPGPMWIRDTAAQVSPLLAHTPASADLRRLVDGAVLRMAKYILTDPYANAFSFEPGKVRGNGDYAGGAVFERKFELDSGAYFFRVLDRYEAAAPEAAAALLTRSVDGVQVVREAARLLVRVYQLEQDHEASSGYTYVPKNRDHPEDDLDREGKGAATRRTGMVWTGFRPSDDKATYGFHVPSNLFLASTLGAVARFASGPWQDDKLAAAAAQLRDDIRTGVHQAGVTKTKDGTVYCYEVDGMGGCNLMDDANVPSLLSFPYLDPTASLYDADVYARTRAMVLSPSNPFFFTQAVDVGSRVVTMRGLGSPHTEGAREKRIWPLGMVVEALTASSTAERDELLTDLDDILQVVEKAGDRELLPESFADGAGLSVTRQDFGWADALYFELLERSGRCTLDPSKLAVPATRSAPAAATLPLFLAHVPGWQLTMDPLPSHGALSVGADGSLLQVEEHLRRWGEQVDAAASHADAANHAHAQRHAKHGAASHHADARHHGAAARHADARPHAAAHPAEARQHVFHMSAGAAKEEAKEEAATERLADRAAAAQARADAEERATAAQERDMQAHAAAAEQLEQRAAARKAAAHAALAARLAKDGR